MGRKSEPCTVDGCSRLATAARGMCGTHYSRWQRGTDIARPVRPQAYADGTTCSVPGCGQRVLAKALCSLHYQRLTKRGDVQASRPPKGDPTERWCPDCEQSRPRTEFYALGNGRLSPYCKRCSGRRSAATVWRNHARLLSWRRKWTAENRERLRQQDRDRYRKNPAKFINYTQRRQAMRKGAVSTMTQSAWAEILEYFDHRCAYCLEKDCALEQDHVVALVRGGDDTPENIVPACKVCNARKNCHPVFFTVAATSSPAGLLLRD